MPYIELHNRLVEYKRLFKYYTLQKSCKKNLYISLIDGRYYHGGMADRFKGMVSIYAFCKAQNLDYRICYKYPFQLENYLIPNIYNWQLKDNEFLSYNIFHSKPLILSKETEGKRLFRTRSNKQFHIYFNRDILEQINTHFQKNYQWGELFHELFKPTARLSAAIEQNLTQISQNYIALVFRFQQLLGDFNETGYPILSDPEKQILIQKCLAQINQMHTQHPHQAFLITSDSISFLQEAQKIENCYIIPGKLTHMDYTRNDDFDIHLKSFVDFFMLSKSQKIYSIGTKQMYPSEFPLYAAKLGNIPFQRIWI